MGRQTLRDLKIFLHIVNSVKYTFRRTLFLTLVNLQDTVNNHKKIVPGRKDDLKRVLIFVNPNNRLIDSTIFKAL